MPHEVILHLRRQRFLPQDGGGTVFCVATYDGNIHGALGYVRPGKFPEFEGDTGWFRVRWFSKSRFDVLEQVADKRGSPLVRGT